MQPIKSEESLSASLRKNPDRYKATETVVKCLTCQESLSYFGTMTTLVGYGHDEPGHDHDDNCRMREYFCKNGHTFVIFRRNRCPQGDWMGKESCFCHPGPKADKWPEEV